MKPLGNSRPKNGRRTINLSGQGVMNLIAASSFLSVVTLVLVILSFYAIPRKVERAHRTEELQAMRELAARVNDLTDSIIQMETDNARSNSTGNPR